MTNLCDAKALCLRDGGIRHWHRCTVVADDHGEVHVCGACGQIFVENMTYVESEAAESVSNEINSRLVTAPQESKDLGSAAKSAPLPTGLDWLGCPVRVDDTMPAGRIELRDAVTDHVLARIDTKVYARIRIYLGEADK